ncbi:MAG TPA: hypothetical protein VFM43_05460 [Gaiellaceae bacterium]|nr:hypothetical protein [Gaiellaceae bacterium]
MGHENEQAKVVAGFQEKNTQIEIAHAHTFFLAPVPGHKTLDQPLFSNFREVHVVDKKELLDSGRLAALTHDARVTLIRRKLYFRYRLPFSFEDVREWEAARIKGDSKFTGPKPEWAQ